MGGYSVGNFVTEGGFVTRLHFLRPGHETWMEDALGYRRGMLAQGYLILLLAKPLDPAQFELHLGAFSTMSGARIGLPPMQPGQPDDRERLSDAIAADRGQDGYDRLRGRVAERFPIQGRERVAKIKVADAGLQAMQAELRSELGLAPGQEIPSGQLYPPGTGVPQWIIVGRSGGVEQDNFFVAARVEPGGIVRTPNFTLQLHGGGPMAEYEARSSLRRYLEKAPS